MSQDLKSLLADSQYAKRKTELNELISDLRSTGIGQDLSLPAICVIGSQSAGKSSLLEAISRVQLPRASGTCTRVPTEVTLHKIDGPWAAQVSLRFEVDNEGKRLEKVNQVSFGPPLTDPSAVSDILKRAQLAILDTAPDVAHYLTAPLAALVRLDSAFSRNPILLDISGPDYLDLSLIDLPGIIQTGDADGDVTLVKNIVQTYIEKTATIILLTVNTSDDIQNQEALAIAKVADPDGLRTIGCLTKPDRIENGNEHRWISIFRGESHNLRLGYFVTRQPTPEELISGISFDRARKLEANFFMSSSWASLKQFEKRRLGILNLAAFLSDQLTQTINSRLPKLIQSILDANQDVRLQLAQIPPAPARDTLNALFQKCAEFNVNLRDAIKGASNKQIVQSINEEWKAFAAQIRRSRPQFIARKRTEDDASPEEDSEKLVMYLDEKHVFIEQKITREMAFTIPNEAKTELAVMSISTWYTLAETFLDAVRPVLEDGINVIIDHHFGSYAHTGLPTAVEEVVRETIQELHEKARVSIRRKYQQELLPSTLNDHYISDSRDKYLAKFKREYAASKDTLSGARDPHDSRELALANAADQEKTAARTQIMSQLAILYPDARFAADDLDRILPASKYESILEVAAEIAAYVKVASKRYIDAVKLEIESDLIQPLPDAIFRALSEHLGLSAKNGRERASSFLQENSETTLLRAELEASKERFEKAQRQIRAFQRNSGSISLRVYTLRPGLADGDQICAKSSADSASYKKLAVQKGSRLGQV